MERKTRLFHQFSPGQTGQKGEDNEQFLKAYNWDGKEFEPLFELDFTREKLGRPHLMRFGSASFYQ